MQRRSASLLCALALFSGVNSGCSSTQEARTPAAEPVLTDDAQVAGLSDAEIDRSGDLEIARVADLLDQRLVQQVMACRILADNALVGGYYAGEEKPHETLTALRDTVSRSTAVVASLVDANGVVTISSDPTAEGYQYSRWGFFRDGFAGDVLVLPSVGFVSQKRALFALVPHESAEGDITGVVILRSEVTPFDQLLDELSYPAALVYRDRYALATNRPELGFNGLRRLDERGATIDLKNGELFDVLDAVVPAIGETVTDGGITYAVERIPMAVPDWTLLIGRAQ